MGRGVRKPKCLQIGAASQARMLPAHPPKPTLMTHSLAVSPPSPGLGRPRCERGWDCSPLLGSGSRVIYSSCVRL